MYLAVKDNVSCRDTEMSFFCPDFKVGGGEGEGEGEMVNETQWSARVELDQLRQRVAELEAQLGLRKKRGLCFTVSVPLVVLADLDINVQYWLLQLRSATGTCTCMCTCNYYNPPIRIPVQKDTLIIN